MGTKAFARSMLTGGAVAEAAHPAIAEVLLAPPTLVAVPATVHTPCLPLLRALQAERHTCQPAAKSVDGMCAQAPSSAWDD